MDVRRVKYANSLIHGACFLYSIPLGEHTMSEFMDSVKIILLLTSTLILLAVFTFTLIEGIISQLDRDLVDSLVYYLIATACLVGILWAYSRSKHLIRSMPAEE